MICVIVVCFMHFGVDICKLRGKIVNGDAKRVDLSFRRSLFSAVQNTMAYIFTVL